MNLKQARRLEQELAQLILTNQHSTEIRTIVSIYESLDETVEKTNDSVNEKITKIAQLTKARFIIRREIEKAKESSGLNALMNKEAEVKSLLQFFNQYINEQPLTEKDTDIAKSRLQTLKANPSSGDGYSGPRDTLTLTNVLTVDTLDTIKKEHKRLKKECTDIADKCASLNVTTTITLDKETLSILEKYNLQ